MGRPSTISTDHILHVARQVFLEQGSGASTAIIAAQAGISEGTIYKRFDTKMSLFRAAMGLPDLPDFEDWLARADEESAEVMLTSVLLDLMGLYRQLLPRLMMLWSSPGADPLTLFRDSPEPPPARIVRGIREVIDLKVRSGQLAPADPDACARMMVGSVVHYVFMELMGQLPGGEQAYESYAQRVVANLLSGVAP